VEERWRLEARLDEVAIARRGVRKALTCAGVDADLVALGELATGELVANAMEHGRGSTVDVALRTCPESVVLAVTNEGAAFERSFPTAAFLQDAERGRGLALLAAFGCDLLIACTPPRHCTVTARIPLHAAR